MGNLGSDCKYSLQRKLMGEIIKEQEECVVAATQLRMEYKGKYNSNERPIGCYYWPIDNTVYFNYQNQSVLDSIDYRFIDSRTGGLCKRSM